MKKGLLLICFALFSVASFAQISGWNVKAGLNASNYYGKNADGDAKLGFVVGAGCEYALTKTIFLQPSLLLTSKGSKAGEITMNAMYLELPVMAAARFPMGDNMNVVVNAGPYVAYGVAGKTSGAGLVSSNTFDTLNRFDVGAGLGASLEMGKLVFGIDAKLGALNIVDKVSTKNISSSLTVGYKF